MRFESVGVFASLITLICLLAPACSAEPGAVDDDGDTRPDAAADASRRDGATPRPDASGTRDASATVRDGAIDAESEVDAASEQDAGSGEPGSACSTPGSLYERACGICGLKAAACINGVIGGYGACNERHPGFCQGETDAGATDAGEPVDPWDGYSIDIDFAPGATGSIAMPAATGVRNRMSVLARSTCPISLPASPSPTDYALVRVRNTTAQSLTVDVNVTRGAGPTDVILAMYAAPPSTDDELKSCFGSADGNTCPDPAGTAGSGLSCLTGVAGVVLPALSSSYAYVAMYSTAAAWNGPGLRFTRQP